MQERPPAPRARSEDVTHDKLMVAECSQRVHEALEPSDRLRK